MQNISQALLPLDHLYRSASLTEYKQVRQVLDEQTQQEFLGFTIAYAVEIGTVGAGCQQYQHGGVAHVLPLEETEGEKQQ